MDCQASHLRAKPSCLCCLVLLVGPESENIICGERRGATFAPRGHDSETLRDVDPRPKRKGYTRENGDSAEHCEDERFEPNEHGCFLLFPSATRDFRTLTLISHGEFTGELDPAFSFFQAL